MTSPATPLDTDSRAADAEFRDLRRELQELEVRISPHEPAPPIAEKSPVILQIERQLQLLETEMSKSSR